MTVEESWQKFLAILEENPNENTKPIIAAIRKMLGMEKPDPIPPTPTFQGSKKPPEYPQYRVKWAADGTEIGRRRCNTSRDFELLLKQEPEMLWAQSFAVPIEKEEVTP